MAQESVRILLCHACNTREVIPDYVGLPEHDDALTVLASRHASKHPDQMNSGLLMKVDKKHWDSPTTRAAIEKQINESSGHTGFDPSFYSTKATFEDDAFKCWQAHGRTENCADYCSKKKLLMPDTNKERKEAGVDKYHSTTYLCSFCPVHSVAMTAQRKRLGAYSK